jgi:hypothetical protein
MMNETARLLTIVATRDEVELQDRLRTESVTVL